MKLRCIPLLLLSAAFAVGCLAQNAPTAEEEDLFRKLGMGPVRDWDAQGVTYAEWLLYVGLGFNNTELVRRALSYGADANKARDPHPLSKNGDNGPPLYRAVLRPNAKTEIVDLLLRNGADVNARYSPSYMDPEQTGHDAYGRFVLRNYKAEEDTGRFPLYDAAAHSNAGIVERLILAGADVNARTAKFGRTALFVTRDNRIATTLLAHGAAINARDTLGHTPLAVLKRWIDDQPALSNHPENRESLQRLQQARDYYVWLIGRGATN